VREKLGHQSHLNKSATHSKLAQRLQLGNSGVWIAQISAFLNKARVMRATAHVRSGSAQHLCAIL
jgi:hypothetical protein